MFFVKANPNEYLVVGHGGRVENRGPAASAFLRPGWTHVLVPGTQQEADFCMTQESRDGIPLRFKGIAIYRINDPETAARRFNFARRAGIEEINTLVTHVCLGELRETVSHLTMDECIEQRKTTLTDRVVLALREVSSGGGAEAGWGIQIDTVQVAQVFIVDDELRRQLEAEVRNQLRSRSELSSIRAQESIEVAQSESARRLQREQLEAERERIEISLEKVRIQKASEREATEIETPVSLFQIDMKQSLIERELNLRRLEHELIGMTVQTELLGERARQELRKEILPLEQIPGIAEAASKIFQRANLTFYGEASPLVASLAPLLGLLSNGLRRVMDPTDSPDHAPGAPQSDAEEPFEGPGGPKEPARMCSGVELGPEHGQL